MIFVFAFFVCIACENKKNNQFNQERESNVQEELVEQGLREAVVDIDRIKEIRGHFSSWIRTYNDYFRSHYNSTLDVSGEDDIYQAAVRHFNSKEYDKALNCIHYIKELRGKAEAQYESVRRDLGL